jgi:hypothetical protein
MKVLCLFGTRRLEGLNINIGDNIKVDDMEIGSEDANRIRMAWDIV